MNSVNPLRGQAVRAASKIREHLLEAAGARLLDPLPQMRWSALARLFDRWQLARGAGWIAASRHVARDLEFHLRRLVSELEEIHQQLPRQVQPERVAAPGSIAGDLGALTDEFEAVEFELKARWVAVNTPPIVLEDVYLGPFQIVLRWEQIGNGTPYEVIALDAQPAEGQSDVTHPHVRENRLCEGEGSTAIRAALAEGRLLDFFLLVRQILQTYNGGSAYVSLEDWTDSRLCSDCGGRAPVDDSSSCERCGECVCNDCSGYCHDCGRTLCSECSSACAGCEHYFCQGCLTAAPGQNVFHCESCLTAIKGEPADEEEERSDAAPAADAVCLGEAAEAA